MILAESAEVTSIPERALLTLACIGIIVGLVWLMRRGWLRKQSVQSEIEIPQSDKPENFTAIATISGRYLASTAAGAWLTRIAVHDLGIPSRCEVHIAAEGMFIERPSATSIFIPRDHILGIRSDRAIAGRAFEKDGIVIVTWRLGDIEVDSGLRADDTAGHLQLLNEFSTQESGA